MLLLAWIVVFTDPQSLATPLVYGGVTLVVLVTAVAFLVRWEASTKQWAVLLPIIDIFAIIAVREGQPTLGSGLFLVFPVMWLARNFGVLFAAGGVALSTVLLWGAWLTRAEADAAAAFPTLLLLPITLAFIATTSYISARRERSQRVLLRQQASMVESAFDRARVQERLLEVTLDSVEFGVVAFDREGQVSLVNEAHRRSLVEYGSPRTAIMYREMYQADRKTPYPVHNRPFARAVAGQSFENLTVWVGSPDGEQAALSVTSRQLVGPDGERDGGILVLRDVTAELAAISARDSLIGSVSHELRTPLTSIIGYLDLAIDDPNLSDETRRMIGISYENSERLLVLVTDLLLAASDRDSHLPLQFQSTDIGALVAHAIDAARLGAEERSIRIVSEIGPDATASADPVRMRQVVDNLLSNAIKYNRSHGEIRVAVHSTEEAVQVSVTDTGFGIAEADRAQLFDRFFRTESARASAAIGSGLGLSVSRDIVRQHAGDLTVDSEVGVGSTFALTIPREAPAAEPLDQEH
jgi:signal transduction histidine kinase